jgi:hypothetical protein
MKHVLLFFILLQIGLGGCGTKQKTQMSSEVYHDSLMRVFEYQHNQEVYSTAQLIGAKYNVKAQTVYNIIDYYYAKVKRKEFQSEKELLSYVSNYPKEENSYYKHLPENTASALDSIVILFIVPKQTAASILIDYASLTNIRSED